MSDLIPWPNKQGPVLVNANALNDPAVMATLERLHQENYVFKPSRANSRWDISDRD